MSDDYIDIDDDVRDAVDGLAADCNRADYDHAKERLQTLKARWLNAGAEAYRRAASEAADQELAWARRASVKIATRDGLVAPFRIESIAPGGHWPRSISLAARPKIQGLIEAADFRYESSEIRTYTWDGERGKDGKPVYREDGV
jgi:hypothetical protein